MINSTDDSMELIIAEPLSLPSLLKSLNYYHESSGYSSKEAECSGSENKIHDVKLRTHTNRPVDIHRRRHKISTPTIMSNTDSLTIDESLPVMITDKTNHRLSPICDEQLEHFPLINSTDNNRISTKSSSYQSTTFARRHFHIYDWTRLSFYDNVPIPFGYLSEPLIIEDCSPISTSTSSNDDKNISTNRKDSGLGTSSIERQIDSIILTTNNINRSLSPSSSSSSSLNSNITNTSSRLPTSRKIRVKWHSFTKTHRPSFNSSKYHLGQMSVGQLLALRRAALIRLQELFDTTRILSMNKPTLVNRTIPSRQCLFATAFSAVPKLIIRRHQQRKEIHHEIKKLVFGVSLLSMTQRTGHPVPITIISAMKYLRRTSIDSVGIFRKPGVAHRIKRLHDLIESNFEFHKFDEFSPYDVSDVLKQYFRLLPECLFTIKLSPLFLHINDQFSSIDKNFLKINNERRLLALQYSILLLPDENRLVLHLLLSFLNDVSKHSKTNQMSSINLATCFAPTLFSFNNSNKFSSNNGMPDLKEIEEQRKAMDILSFMIDHVRLLFIVPNELHQACHFSYIEIGEPCTLEELSRRIIDTTIISPIINKSRRYLSNKRTIQKRTKEIGIISASDSIGSLSSSSSCENILLNVNNNNNNNLKSIKIKTNTSYQNFIDRCIIEVMRESCYTKLKGWTSFGKNNDIELAYKKLNDGHPLGLWKCSIEIEAPPIEILNRLLNERHLWDDDFQSGTIIEKLNRNTHVYQYTINSMAPLASRYFCEVRSWRINIQLNTDGNYQNNKLSINLPVNSSLSTSSNAITSLISTQNNQRREACVLVCTSIEHPKGHCPPKLVRAVTLASRYLIQSYGCGKSKITHLSRVDLMGRSHEWYSKVYGSILTRSMMKLRDSFVHLNTGPETKV
ncbi:unnamed protein product [Rotaria sordida]|uniref:Rho GTPase-activating protein 7 n=1 Tax=Rotaria sordida TaxID=392033 RepID=A0A813YGG7_9BILA|nr:unnamed protein product [Rotaria sordida]CAF1005971.1 unnamed protein product [Rotaria sordida]CAF3590668.1 unnamed protein product [Rotaria sordida]CAF3668315.1 unnamed protein product [Rotaria sordida]